MDNQADLQMEAILRMVEQNERGPDGCFFYSRERERPSCRDYCFAEFLLVGSETRASWLYLLCGDNCCSHEKPVPRKLCAVGWMEQGLGA